MLLALTIDQFIDHAVAAPARDIDIVGARLLQREADKFAASLNPRPVVKLVAHGRSAPLSSSRVSRSCHLRAGYTALNRPAAHTVRRPPAPSTRRACRRAIPASRCEP